MIVNFLVQAEMLCHTWDTTYGDNVILKSNGSFSVTIKGGTDAVDTLIGPDYAY